MVLPISMAAGWNMDNKIKWVFFFQNPVFSFVFFSLSKVSNRFYSGGIDRLIFQFILIDEKIDLSNDYGDIKSAKHLNVGEKLSYKVLDYEYSYARSTDVGYSGWSVDQRRIITFIKLSKYPSSVVWREIPTDNIRIYIRYKWYVNFVDSDFSA